MDPYLLTFQIDHEIIHNS